MFRAKPSHGRACWRKKLKTKNTHTAFIKMQNDEDFLVFEISQSLLQIYSKGFLVRFISAL